MHINCEQQAQCAHDMKKRKLDTKTAQKTVEKCVEDRKASASREYQALVTQNPHLAKEYHEIYKVWLTEMDIPGAPPSVPRPHPHRKTLDEKIEAFLAKRRAQ